MFTVMNGSSGMSTPPAFGIGERPATRNANTHVAGYDVMVPKGPPGASSALETHLGFGVCAFGNRHLYRRLPIQHAHLLHRLGDRIAPPSPDRLSTIQSRVRPLPPASAIWPDWIGCVRGATLQRSRRRPMLQGWLQLSVFDIAFILELAAMPLVSPPGRHVASDQRVLDHRRPELGLIVVHQ